VMAAALITPFQSTRPARGATAAMICSHMAEAVSIHAPRAGRDSVSGPPAHLAGVSIHAPRAGRDKAIDAFVALNDVSIHAPRAGRDASGIRLPRFITGFNPRAPRGARPDITDMLNGLDKFQSTRPARGATK